MKSDQYLIVLIKCVEIIAPEFSIRYPVQRFLFGHTSTVSHDKLEIVGRYYLQRLSITVNK